MTKNISNFLFSIKLNAAALARWTILLWLFIAILSYRYVGNIPSMNLQQYLYLALIEIGHFGGLAIIFSLPFYLAGIFLPARSFILFTSVIFAILINLLFVDTVVFSLFKFHLSLFLIDLLRFGGEDVINFSKTMWLITILIQLGIFFIVYKLGKFSFAFKFLSKLQLVLVYFVILLSALFYNLWHAWEDATYKNNVQIFKKNFPIYYPLTAKQFLYTKGWAVYSEEKQVDYSKLALNTKNKNFKYPLEKLNCDFQKNYNYLVIVVDALRHDVLTKKYTPNSFNFANSTGAWRAQKHLAGANVTKSGIFALFYSLPSSYYWDLSRSVQPIFFQKLQQKNYDFKILASANLKFPDFSVNVFSGIENLRLETPGATPNDRDERITKDWLEFTQNRQKSENKKPFFGFLFYDSVHAYQAPVDFPKFEPYQSNTNYISLNNKYDVTPYFNKYRTSVKYTDTLIGKVLDDLKQKNLLEDTIVLITSDHGEEFNDNKQNYWGHTGNFSYAQTRVPFVLYLPQTKGGEIAGTSSHYDFVPTIMQEVLNCKNPTGDYSFGNNLFKKREIKYIPASSYVHDVVMLEDGYIIFTDGFYEIFDYQMQKLPVEKERQILKEAYKVQTQVGRFLY